MRPGEYRQNGRKGNERVVSACEMASGIEHVHLSAGVDAPHFRIAGELPRVVGINVLQVSGGMKAIEQKPASLADIAVGVEEDDVGAIDHLL